MILNVFGISFLFALSFWINFYLASIYFQLDITLPILIFFAKELKFIKFVIIVLFVIFMNVLLEKFAFMISIYIFAFSLLIYFSKRNFNIISIKYIFFSTMTFMIFKFTIIYLVFYKNLILNGMLLLNIIFDICINSISAIFIFYTLERLIYRLRNKSEKVLCSS